MKAQERKALVKNLLDRAAAGERDAREVLVDVIHDEHPDLAEDLSLALQGRAVFSDVYPPFPGAGGVLNRRGDPLPAHLRVASISHELGRIRRVIFPKRRPPCMPSRKALFRYFESIHGQIGRRDEHERKLFAELWSTLREACEQTTLRAVERAMSRANDLLRGSGVEYLRVPTRRGGVRRAWYINQGDTYDETLIWDRETERFYLASWGEIVEGWERRFGRTDEPVDPDDWD